jgi:cysteine-S-conjugate beta-lyase
LVVPYDLTTLRALTSASIKPGLLVRFSIGLEDAPDLQADIAQALGHAFG